MCGIAGICSFSVTPDHGELAAMLDAIHHRGPDDRGTFDGGPVRLGMTRLAIIDLAGGKQPMSNEDGSVSVVFNGEIYDYRELAARLRSSGHRLATASDTEVIAHLYEERGLECVDHLRGMFAFALWDARARRLLLARDRLGIKPLYYVVSAGKLYFASEIKALLCCPGVVAELDEHALGLYLSLKYVPAPHTLFRGIRSLPPGHLLTCDEGGVSVSRYWDLEFADTPVASDLDEAAAAERLKELLQEAVDLHLRADVPFGAFLSGGLDSSLIVALMSRTLQEPVRTFSLGFEAAGAQASELDYAREVARAFGTRHHEVMITPSAFIEDAERVIWHLDQPIADQSTVATYKLAEAAASQVKMVLTGEGGDELFAGYARYGGERRADLFASLPTPLRRLAWSLISRLPGQGLRRAKIALYALLQHEESGRFASWFPLFTQASLPRVLGPALREVVDPAAAARVFAEHLERVAVRDPVQRMLYVDSKLWLPDFLLLRGDKLTMAQSLEARVPLLDHVVAEFAAGRPSSEKVGGGERKRLLKRVARDLLPAHIVDRPKQGFPVPINSWLRREARDFVHDLLSPTTLKRRDLFDPAEVTRLLAEHDKGLADHSPLLWGLASIEIWHNVFLTADSSWLRPQVGARPQALNGSSTGATLSEVTS